MINFLEKLLNKYLKKYFAVDMFKKVEYRRILSCLL
jgi:hypothetical protein